MTQGGTELYCQECKAYTKQKSLGWTDQSEYKSIGIDPPGKYSYLVGDRRIDIFQRVRQCMKCTFYFETFELNDIDFHFLMTSGEKLFNLDLAIHDNFWKYQNSHEEDEKTNSEEAD